MLDRERGEPGARNAGPAHSRFEADSPENRPVPLAWLDGLAMRLAEQVLAKTETSSIALGCANARRLVVIRTTALRTAGETPNRASPLTTRSSQGLQT
jgi:hypothetical protein